MVSQTASTPKTPQALAFDDVGADRFCVDDDEVCLVLLKIGREDRQRRFLLSPKAARALAGKLETAAREAENEQNALVRSRLDL